MSPEAQRIAIAEACGWSVLHQQPTAFGHAITVLLRPDGRGKVWEHGHTGLASFSINLPDYLNDLNAMAEAEKLIAELELKAHRERRHEPRSFSAYADKLRDVVGGVPGSFAHVTATAAQRAEAFLKTICKWQESPTSANAAKGKE